MNWRLPPPAGFWINTRNCAGTENPLGFQRVEPDGWDAPRSRCCLAGVMHSNVTGLVFPDNNSRWSTFVDSCPPFYRTSNFFLQKRIFLSDSHNNIALKSSFNSRKRFQSTFQDVGTCSSHYEWAIKKIKAHCKKTR